MKDAGENQHTEFKPGLGDLLKLPQMMKASIDRQWMLWFFCGLACIVTAIVAAGAFAPGDPAAGGFDQSAEPDYYLWAWRREEDLSFIDPDRVKVALWTATITLDHDDFNVEYRTKKVTYPSEAEITSVVRLEAIGVPGAATTARLADAIIDVGLPFVPVEHQLDFDARLSQRAFYRHLLEELRVRTGGARLSITALASWCFYDDWTEGLPVDAVVPMIYRMGPDSDVIRHTLHAEREFPNPICAGNVGYSSDEPLAPVDGLSRIFLFHPVSWTEFQFTELVQRVEAL